LREKGEDMREYAKTRTGERRTFRVERKSARKKLRTEGGAGLPGSERRERFSEGEGLSAIYRDEAGSISLLTAEEEAGLARRVERGDREARDMMIRSNLRLVMHYALRYAGRGLPFEDLVEEGNLGLIKAVDRFRVSKGCRLSTYATWWIQNYLERAVVNQASSVRLPVNLRTDMDRLGRVWRELENELGREPAVEELASRMKVSGRRVKKLLSVRARCVSLDAEDDDGLGLMDRLDGECSPHPSEITHDTERKRFVSSLLGGLTGREREIIRRRFGLDGEASTLAEIGGEMGVTRERVRQMEKKVMEKVRARAESLGLESGDIL